METELQASTAIEGGPGGCPQGRHLFSHRSGGCKSRVEGVGGAVSSVAAPPGWQGVPSGPVLSGRSSVHLQLWGLSASKCPPCLWSPVRQD